MFDAELVKILAEAGIGIFAVATIAILFSKLMKAHNEERTEWRASQEKQTDKMVEAIRDLAIGINDNNHDS